MFKRKNKHHAEEMSFDQGKYLEALLEWNANQPTLVQEDLPKTIVSDIEKGSFLYLTWMWKYKELGVQTQTEGEDIQTFYVKIRLDHIDQFCSELGRFLTYEDVSQISTILDGFTEYYTGTKNWIEKGITVYKDDDSVRLTWADYTKKEPSYLQNKFSVENLTLLHTSLQTFLQSFYEYKNKQDAWYKEQPQKWMYPLERE